MQGTESIVLDPVLGLELTAKCMLRFLARHLPLTNEQQVMLESAAAIPRPLDSTSQNSHAEAISDQLQVASVSSTSVANALQRQPPVQMGAFDRSQFEAATEGHLFKLELAT